MKNLIKQILREGINNNLFEVFNQPENTGVNSAWEVKSNGKVIKVTFKDVMDYLDNIIEIDPNEIKDLLIDVKRDPKRIKNADYNYPIIIISKGGKYTSILDGQHRVVKALRDGVNIRARILYLDFAPNNFKKVFKS